jgi:putative transcriptional regulator
MMENGTLSPGKILIAHPFLKDPNFSRSVVLLCEHREEGSFGFIFNKGFSKTLDELIPSSVSNTVPVYFGGPVQLDTVHFLHNVPDLIEGGFMVHEGLYWGGDIERAIALLNTGLLDQSRIKFFIGYSGWDGGQLDHEMEESSWIVSDVTARLFFDGDKESIWSASLRSMGKEFAALANYPIDPSLN